MAAGGIHDQLGGGFHRYSTDARWLVPHFEQMLYDNAQLARVYAHAWALTGDRAYRDTAVGVLDYLLRELRTADGGFAASQDADTEGEEGATFVWSAAEVRSRARRRRARSRAVRRRVRRDRRGQLGGLDDPVAGPRRRRARRAVRADRRGGRRAARGVARACSSHGAPAGRSPPATTRCWRRWNGLAIAALADASRALAASGDADRRGGAAPPLPRGGRGRGRRGARRPGDARGAPAAVVEGRPGLGGRRARGPCVPRGRPARAVRGDPRRALVPRGGRGSRTSSLERFADPAGGFFDTADDGEALVVRPKDVQDNATPSGNAMATTVLLRLAALTGEGRYRDGGRARARDGRAAARPLSRPGFAQWLCALELAHAGISEVALVGAPDDPGPRAARRRRRPRLPAVPGPRRDRRTPRRRTCPLLRDRFALGGRATAFVCRDFACRQPVHEPEALDALLAGG